MWHDLWPMHRGCGYVQNYLDGNNMNSLETDLTSVYQPAFRGCRTKLYLARQWKKRSPGKEKLLLEHPAVAESAAVSSPDEMRGSVVKAFVVLEQQADVSEKELQRHCHSQLEDYMVPQMIEFRDHLERRNRREHRAHCGT